MYNYRGIRNGTSLKWVCPRTDVCLPSDVDKIKSLDTDIIDNEFLSCDPRRIPETIQGKQLQWSEGVDTQDSCYSMVPGTTVWGILSTEESGDITPMNGLTVATAIVRT